MRRTSIPSLGDVWDSGKVLSSQENHVVYAGVPLTADTEYFWKVRTWNREGNAGPYSTNTTFAVGLLTNSDWSWSVMDQAQHQRLRRLHLLSQYHSPARRASDARDGLCNERA